MNYRKLRVAWLIVGLAICLLLIALWMRSYLNRDRFDAFQPRVGMTMAEVEAALGEFSWRYIYSDSGDPIPGERFRSHGELGFGRNTAPDGRSRTKYRLLLRFEGWRVWDKDDHLIEDHPLLLDSWERDAYYSVK